MIPVLKTHVQLVIRNGVLIYGSMYITRLKNLDQTFSKLHRTIIHKKQILTECYHLYSATDLHLYELFQTLNKVISTENSVDILRIIISLEDLIKLSKKNQLLDR